MLRSLFIVCSLSHFVVLGGLARFDDKRALTLTTERRRDAVDLEEHKDAVMSIAVAAGFKFRRCAKAISWASSMQRMFAGIFAGAMQGIFMNFQAEERRRFGFNVNNFLTGVAAEMDAQCSEGEDAVIQSCTERAQMLIENNSEASKEAFAANFPFLSDGADDLLECAKDGMPSVCSAWYQTLCQ